MAFDEALIVNAVLAGTREYLANAQKISAANEEIGLSTERAGLAMARTTRRGYLMNQALFTVRRLMYGVTLATIASGVAAVKWGFDFNSAMQQARVALRPLQSDTFNVRRELDYLFNFTKYTPFQFKDITIAFRQMYGAMAPLGVTAQDVNGYIKAMVDALSFAGRTTPGALNRVAVALQHIAFQGHLTGQGVTQLARDGLPIYAALRKELGLTADQMHHVGTLGIPTQVAIKALHDYIESTPGFMNAAHRQAVGSFHGLFTTFKDNLSQLMGAVEIGWFARMQGFLVRVNGFFDSISGAMRHHASVQGLMGAINDRLTPGSNAIILFWNQFSGTVRQAWLIFSQFVTTVLHSQTIWAMLYLGLAAVHGALWLVSRNGLIVKGVVNILLPLWIAFYTYTKLNAIWLGILRFEEALLTKQMKEMTFAQMLVTLWLDRQIYAEKIGIATTLAFATATEVWTGAQWTLAAAIDASIFRLKMLRLGMLGLAGLTVSAIVLLTLIPRAKQTTATTRNPWATNTEPGAERAFGRLPIVGGLFSQVNRLSDAIGNRLHHWHVPGFAAGGMTSYSGNFWVGEHGPELLSLPAGSRVMNNQQSMAFAQRESWMNRGQDRQPIILKIGERVLESIVVDLNTGRLARA